jgi:hypothetical protein
LGLRVDRGRLAARAVGVALTVTVWLVRRRKASTI